MNARVTDWPTRTLVDPATRLSERELDRLKERTRIALVAVRNGAIWAADTVASRAYNEAHLALLACRTEEEVARIEQGFSAAMTTLREAIDAKA